MTHEPGCQETFGAICVYCTGYRAGRAEQRARDVAAFLEIRALLAAHWSGVDDWWQREGYTWTGKADAVARAAIEADDA